MLNWLVLVLVAGFLLMMFILDRQQKRLLVLESWRDQITEYCKKGTGEDVSA